MYATTRDFLIRFGLNDLSDLPKNEEMSEVLGLEVMEEVDRSEMASTTSEETQAEVLNEGNGIQAERMH